GFIYLDFPSIVEGKDLGIRVEALDLDNRSTRFDMTLACMEKERGLDTFIEYSSDLFDPDTIKRMLGHLESILHGILANPDTPVSLLPLLTESEHHQIVVEWNNTQADYPKESCVHQLFEEQAECTPDAIALVCENERLSYQELNHR